MSGPRQSSYLASSLRWARELGQERTSFIWSDFTQEIVAAPENIYDKLFTCVSEDMKSRSIEGIVEPAQAEVFHVRHQSCTPLSAVEVEPPHVLFPVPETGVEGPAWF